MVYSHTIAIATKATVGGAVFGWDEVECGSPKDPCPWEIFIETCKEIGYDGYFSHEQCSPIIVKDTGSRTWMKLTGGISMQSITSSRCRKS